MRLHGIHHVTCITGDAPTNVDFYTGTLGLRLVKKTVNQDDPPSTTSSTPTNAARPAPTSRSSSIRGRSPAVPATAWCTACCSGSAAKSRSTSGSNGSAASESTAACCSRIRRVSSSSWSLDDGEDPPLVARHPEIPEEHALRGFAGVRAYASSPDRSASLLEQLTLTRAGEGWESRGTRHGSYVYDAPPAGRRGVPGAGTVHHVAWSVPLDEHAAWVEKAAAAGAHPTPVIDRFWFHSIYFREPSGVLFEIASLGPGFTADEELEHLGEKLILPPAFEHLRAEVEPKLTPLPNPRG